MINWLLKHLCAIALNLRIRDVAQSGSVLAWGARGRKFESCHPDKKLREVEVKESLNQQGCLVVVLVTYTMNSFLFVKD